MKHTMMAGLLCLAAGLGGLARAETAELGKPAPDFTLTDTNGKTNRLADFKGKFVVLEWCNPDCPFVKKHYNTGNMQRLQKEYTAKGVVWLTINSSAPGKQGHYPAAKWNAIEAERKAAPTAVLLDPDGKVGRLFGAKTTPHMFVIDTHGILIYAGAIDDQPSFDPQTVKTAKNYVQLALEAALAGQPVATPMTQSYGCSVKY